MSASNTTTTLSPEAQFLAAADSNKGLYLGPILFGLFVDGAALGMLITLMAFWRMQLSRTDPWPLRLLMVCYTYQMGLMDSGH
jgi:hypothetical protein